MANLSDEERLQLEAGARAFVQELQKTSPQLLVKSDTVQGKDAGEDAALLERYTESLGRLATAKFPDAVQSLLEDEDEDVGLLQSGDGAASIGHFVLRAFQKRLCNPAAQADLKDELQKVRKEHGLDINPTAAGISGSAATVVALSVGTLIGGGPLAVVLAPLAGSVALLLLMVGVDTFCDWAGSKG
jgi:hypothetical protein